MRAHILLLRSYSRFIWSRLDSDREHQVHSADPSDRHCVALCHASCTRFRLRKESETLPPALADFPLLQQ
jgi:hypothetical protein